MQDNTIADAYEFKPDVIVIGSGPAGVSVARVLVEAGVRIVVLEGGGRFEDIPADCWASHPISLEHADISPRFDAADGLLRIADYAARNRIYARSFATMGILARGGLSNVWGGGMSRLDEHDMRECGIAEADMADAYDAVAAHINIVGSESDDMSSFHGKENKVGTPFTLSSVCAHALSAYDQSGNRRGFKLGRSRIAMSSGEGVCSRAYRCVEELNHLSLTGNCCVVDQFVAESIRRSIEGLYELEGVDRNTGRHARITAPNIVLAAGHFATTRLVLDYLGCVKKNFPFLDAPAVALALVLPKHLGGPISATVSGLTELSFRLDIPRSKADYVFGSLLPGTALSVKQIAAQFPMPLSLAKIIARIMRPALMFGLLSFPGHLSQNTLRLCREEDGNNRLVVEGTKAGELPAIIRRALVDARLAFSGLGFISFPGIHRVLKPGTAAHSAGALALSGLADINGAIVNAPGLYAADSTVLGVLPAKSPTFTIMANATRIGCVIAERIKDTPLQQPT